MTDHLPRSNLDTILSWSVQSRKTSLDSEHLVESNQEATNGVKHENASLSALNAIHPVFPQCPLLNSVDEAYGLGPAEIILYHITSPCTTIKKKTEGRGPASIANSLSSSTCPKSATLAILTDASPETLDHSPSMAIKPEEEIRAGGVRTGEV